MSAEVALLDFRAYTKLEYPINIFPSPYIQLCGEEQPPESEKGRRLSFLSRFLLELREV